MVMVSTRQESSKRSNRKQNNTSWSAAGDGPMFKSSLEFWCLHPGIIFREIAEKARSVILV
jgi:hypothetical protein